MSNLNGGARVGDIAAAKQRCDEYTVDRYLQKQRQRQALERLPSFERQTTDDVALLKVEVDKLYRLLTLIAVMLLAIAAIGGVLCLL